MQSKAFGEVRRVLIYRLGSLGDTVVALPCYHQIARVFPNAERRLLTNLPVSEKAPSPSEILGASGLVADYIRYPVGLRTLRGLATVWRQIRKFSPDVLVYLAAPRGLKQAKRDALFFRLCGIKTIIGLPGTEDLQRNRWLAKQEVVEPEAERLARCLQALGPIDLVDPANWDLRLTPEEHRKAEDILAPLNGLPFVGVSVGTKMQSKDWGTENWAEVLRRIASEFPESALALVGAASEFEASSQAASTWTHPMVNLCGKLTPRETAAVLSRARLFLGHDSGPMHLAAAAQTPCVAVFAALRLPAVWFPYGNQHHAIYHRVDCAGCGLSVCVEQRKKCILSITPDEVMAAVREQLATARTVQLQ